MGFVFDIKAGSYASVKYPKITVKYTVYKDYRHTNTLYCDHLWICGVK